MLANRPFKYFTFCILLCTSVTLLAQKPTSEALDTPCFENRVLVDVGSSGVKVTSAEIDICNSRTVGPLATDRTPSNLTNLLKDSKFQKESIDLLVGLINQIKHKALSTPGKKTTSFFLSGTAAFREATNTPDVLAEIYKRTGLHLRVLNPNEEALFAVYSANYYLQNKGLTNQELAVVLDTGGGSFQISYAATPGNFKPSSFEVGSDVLLKAYLKAGGETKTFSKSSYETAQKAAWHLMQGVDLPKEIIHAVKSGQPILTVARMFSFSILPLTGSSNHFSPVQAISLESVNATIKSMLGLSYEDIAKANPSVNQKKPHTDILNLIFAQALMTKLDVNVIYSAQLDSSLQGILYENDASWQKIPHNEIQEEE